MKFASCINQNIGIYPVVDRAKKLEPLYRCGITTAQLRIKDLDGEKLENEIIEAIRISQKYNAQFFINDYWELAIKHGAYGVHLGQEDIQNADLEMIKQSNLRLGISTHTTKEIEIALSFEPSYLAIGPIYTTTSKKMVYTPVGLEDLHQWSKEITYPIVAIGGINISNIDAVLATKRANGIAMISGVLNENGEICEEKTKLLVEKYRKYA